MNSGAEQSSESSHAEPDLYESFYQNALKGLRDNLQHEAVAGGESKEKKVFLSFGRKGVKIFEFLIQSDDKGVENQELTKRNEDLKQLEVISEHALPFISRENRNTKADYCLMDDALYYGSTARGIAKEVYAFENIYQIEGHKDKKIKYFAAIDTDVLRSDFDKYIGSIEAKSTKKAKSTGNAKETDLGSGYSHFFSKRLAKDIRSLENTFEIEFPIVTFELDRQLDAKELKENLRQVYRETDARVYVVEHVENYSVNVLLPNMGGSSFNKLQIYPSNPTKHPARKNRWKVVAMAPRPIVDDDYDLEHLFDSAEDNYRQLWKEIFDNCYITTSDTNPQNILDYYRMGRWRCNKTLVMMANYLLSFSTLVQQRRYLENFFDSVDVKATFKGVDGEKDLYYLLGNKDWSGKMAGRLTELYNNSVECGMTSMRRVFHEDYIVFENSKRVEENILIQHRLQDEYLLRRCQNTEEALGALFYNQDAYFEKYVLASNPLTQDFNRLRMGYTFEWLQKSIEFAIKWYGLKLGRREDFITTLHRWVDQRIGEASIVPQYILDEKSGYWIRAFRHGENEETLLSHLARFVILIQKEWKEATRLDWITKDTYQDLLAYVFKEAHVEKSQIVESVNIDLKIGESGFLEFTNSHYDEDETDKARNVLDYMIDMGILSESERQRVLIHKRTDFFMQPGVTTMEKHVEDAIKIKVREKAREFQAKFEVL